MVHHKNIPLLVVFFLVAVPLFLLAARTTYQDDRANDSTSAYYLCYARNINRYPASLTKLLNVDLVGPQGKAIFKDQPVGFYLDHPPLLTWTVAAVLNLKGFLAPRVPDVLAGRMVSIMASIGILLMTLQLCQRGLGTAPALMAGLAILSCPVFLSHGLVVNFEPLCCCLILAGCLGESRLLFLPALLADWPAFFALPVLALFELKGGLRRRACLTLGVGLFTGVAILFLYGYLSGQADFARGLIHGVASSESGLYRSRQSSLLQQATVVVRTMLCTNFGPLNCLVVLVGCIGWLKNFRSLNRAQLVGISCVAVTLLNIVLFHSWATQHTFWSYYLLPAVAIAYADLARRRSARLPLALCLGASLLYSGDLYLKHLLIPAYGSSAEQRAPVLLNPQPLPVFTDTRHAFWGHGYVARWYFDRPLEFASSPVDPSVAASCSDRPCIWLAENQGAVLPRELFKVYQQGHFGNVYLTTFQVKGRR